MEHICKNCGSTHVGKYCNQCGQIVFTDRFTIKHFTHNFFDKVFDLENGLFFTMYRILISPHKVVSEYVSGITKKYTNPAKFAVYLIGFFTIVMLKFNYIDISVKGVNELMDLNYSDTLKATNVIINFVKDYFQFFTLLYLPFFALASHWLYRKYNYTEHLILHCYVYSLISVLSIAFILFDEYLIISNVIVFLLVMTFYTITFRRLFNSSVFVSFIKSITFYVLAQILISITFLIITFLYAIIHKNLTGSFF
ncbi:MAG: DUF3667 domain-containing protein [Bacteroidales bacterium]|nr:MAG: DUF3667 domain-containing protein [Bacteroidales bacterium]